MGFHLSINFFSITFTGHHPKHGVSGRNRISIPDSSPKSSYGFLTILGLASCCLDLWAACYYDLIIGLISIFVARFLLVHAWQRRLTNCGIDMGTNYVEWSGVKNYEWYEDDGTSILRFRLKDDSDVRINANQDAQITKILDRLGLKVWDGKG